MELKPGYKPTEVGVIPEDWEIVPISTVVSDFRGGAPFKPTDFTKSGVKVLPKGGVVKGGYLQIANEDLQFCTQAYADSHPRNRVDRDYTVVVLRDLVPSGPSIGLMVQIKDDETYVLAQGVYGFKVDERFSIPAYLVQLSNTFWYRRLVNGIMVGSTQVHITNTAFKKGQIPLPSLPEQRAIAGALSEMDALIGALDQLIAKKRDLKQAAMQQLLTGQKRLHGFHGEWKVCSLHDVCVKIQDGTHFSPKLGGNDFLYVTSKNIRFGKLDMSTAERISAAEHFKIYARCDVKKGDLLLTKDGANTGNAALNPLEEPFSLLSSVALLRFDCRRHAPAYFLYQILSNYGQQQIKEMMSGNAITRLTLVKIRALRFAVAAFEEQTAIAEVLSDMDAEIEALEKRREKTRDLKQGMMQELLTGRTRLV